METPQPTAASFTPPLIVSVIYALYATWTCVYVCSSLPHVFLASGSALRIRLAIGSLSAAPASSVFPSFPFEPEPRPLLVMSGRSSDSGECLLA